MILINTLVMFIGALFTLFPVVTVLPTIGGYDIDTALVTGISQLYTFADAFWYITVILQGFGILMAYYGIKLAIRFFFGHRGIK